VTRTYLPTLGYVLGTVFSITGLIVRFSAYEWSVMRPGQSYGGEWRGTSYAFWQHAYSDVGMTLLGFGLALVLLCIHRQLQGTISDEKRQRFMD
jgi:hypothetical protein